MDNTEKIRWLKILRDAESSEGFSSLFEEDEEIDLKTFLDEIICDYTTSDGDAISRQAAIDAANKVIERDTREQGRCCHPNRVDYHQASQEACKEYKAESEG